MAVKNTDFEPRINANLRENWGVEGGRRRYRGAKAHRHKVFLVSLGDGNFIFLTWMGTDYLVAGKGGEVYNVAETAQL